MSIASAVERRMADLVNSARASAGLDPLLLELNLNEAAETHSSWMLAEDIFSHTGDGGSSAGQRMEEAGFTFAGSWSWGENIAWQSMRGAPGIEDDVENLFNSLMNSPGHRANILNASFDYLGIGVEVGDFDGWNAVMVTQKFASTQAPVNLDSPGATNPPQDDPPQEDPPPPPPPEPTEETPPPPPPPAPEEPEPTEGAETPPAPEEPSVPDEPENPETVVVVETPPAPDKPEPSKPKEDSEPETPAVPVKSPTPAQDKEPSPPQGRDVALPQPSLEDLPTLFDRFSQFYETQIEVKPGTAAAIGGNQVVQFLGSGTEDSVVFSGDSSDYRVALGKDSLIVTDLRGEDGTDLLLGVERLVFSDEFTLSDQPSLDLSTLSGVTELQEDQLDKLVQMYIAYFDRAPDAFGLYYWATRLSDGMGLDEIAASFFVQPESLATLPDTDDNKTLVEAAYRNLLEREAEVKGRDYWVDELDSGSVSRAEFMLALINGAMAETGSPDDARVVAEKGDIGLYYSVISGLSDPDNAEAAMELYDRRDGSSLREARELIDSLREEATDGDGLDDALTVPVVGVFDSPFA